MARIIGIIGFIISIVLVMNFRSYKNETIDNSRFNYEVAEKNHIAKEKEMADSAHARMERMNKKEVEEVVVAKGPLVELTTPQLERGLALYGKCKVCHGPRGQGKKSQNAPAIGGQFDWYIEKQVLMMKSGERVNKKMLPYIKRLSGQDVKDLAAYISKLPLMGK